MLDLHNGTPTDVIKEVVEEDVQQRLVHYCQQRKQIFIYF